MTFHFAGVGAGPGLLLAAAVGAVLAAGVSLLRLRVPRLQGHSYQDTQTYKATDFVEDEWRRDPLPKLKSYLLGSVLDEDEWDAIGREAEETVAKAREAAEARRREAETARQRRNLEIRERAREAGPGSW